ncbi:MAG: hypothetical protein ACIAXF_12075 [Phycisphaerales bacterium JB063]
MTATTRLFSTVMMAMLAAMMLARPALAGAPETAVSDETALMVWVDLTIVDEDMIADAGEMLGDIADSPMIQGQGLPLGDIELGILQMQDFRDSFVEAGGEGILLMLAMPEGMEAMPPMTALIRVGEGYNAEALKDAVAGIAAGMTDGAVVDLDEYADGWLAVGMDGAAEVTKAGNADAAARFNAHLAERAEAPLTVVYRMDDNARDMLDGMMEADDPQMAMIAGVLQPLRGMDTAAISVFEVDGGVEIDMAMAFDDSELGGQFLNSFNGILMLAQGMLGMQMAELDNAPSQETIAGFFKHLALTSDDNGATLRLRLGKEFFDAASEMGPAFEEMMGQMQGGGQTF